MNKLSDMPEETIEQAFDDMQMRDSLIEEIRSLKFQMRLLTQTVTILAEDLNARLKRRKQQ